MRLADVDILIVPGLGNSGAGHWQRRWGERFTTAQFVDQDEWDNPRPADWITAIARQIRLATRPVVLIAHSLGVSAVVRAAQELADTKTRGAFLVSAPDLELNAAVPAAARLFGPVPRDPLPFPSMLIASTDDPFSTVERAAEFASCWGSDFHLAGAAGHINVASGHGPWPEGLVMFTRLLQRLQG